MKSWFARWSIRRRIALLALAILLPSAALLAWYLAANLRHARDEAYQRVRILATGTAADLQRMLAQSEALLSRLAARPAVQALDPAHCDPVVSEFVRLNPEYSAFGVRDLQGVVVCAYLPNPVPQLSAQAHPWFDAAVRAGSFRVSDVIVGPRTQRLAVALTHPIRNPAGAMVGILILQLDLPTLGEQLLAATPQGAVVTVADRTRAVVMRSAEAGRFIGTRPPAGEPDPAHGDREGYLATVGRDGVPRLFAFVTLPGVDWRVSASLPEAEVFSEYHRTLTRTLLAGLGVLLLTGLAGWRLSASIGRPIAALEATAARLAAGDDGSRVAIDGPPEFCALAQQFNRMLDARELSEARLRAVFETAVDSIITADESQTIVWANPAAAEMFRCRVDELIGRPLAQLIPGRYRAQHHGEVHAFGAGAVNARRMGNGARSVIAVRADGEEFPIDAAISHVKVGGRQLYTVIHRDITARVRAEAELVESRAKLAAALASMRDAVFITDAQGHLVEFNEAYTGFNHFKSRAECPTDLAEYPKVIEVSLLGGEVLPLEQWAAPRALRGETGTNVEYRLRRIDTGERWIGSFSFAPIRDAGGRIVGSVVVGRDVTELRHARAALEHSHAELQQLIASLDELQEGERRRIARELHDELQQPLAAVRIDLGLLGKMVGEARPEVAPMLAEIDGLAVSAIESTRRIVNNLRPQVLEDLGLMAALELLAAQFSQRTGIRCSVHPDPALAEAGDDISVQVATSLFRVVQEALNNVFKHAQAQRADITLGLRPDGQLVLRIVDDGVGLDLHDWNPAGSVGLLGMRERVRAIGGSLRIDSPPGAGTTLEVRAPARGAPALLGVPGAVGDVAPAPGVIDHLAGIDGVGRLQSAIDVLTAHVAVIDRDGRIQLVNRAWREFAAGNGAADPGSCGPGANYLAVCRRSAQADPIAQSVLDGLTAVIEGRSNAFATEYPCNAPGEERVFHMRARPMAGGSVLVMHFRAS